MQWWGEPWPSAELRAPVCEDDKDRVPPPPPGEDCILCGEGFYNNDRGVMMPHLAADGWQEQRYSHIECLVDNVGGLNQ